jgi:hypothetical protein
MSVSALAASRPASPSVSGVGAVRPAYFKNLSNAGIAALSAAQIGEMRSVEMAALSDSQIKAFNPAALASGLPTYLNNKQVLPTTFISSLSNNQISQFGAPLVNATLSKMSVTQIGAIHTSAISGIGAAALQSLSGAQLSGFTQTQVTQASTTQIASLKPQQISALSPAWLNVLSSSQLQSLGSASIAALTKTQIAGLDAAHVKDLSAAQVASLSKAQLGALNGSQIAAIDATDIKAMTTSQFGALTKTQLQALTVGQIGQVDAFQIRTISAKNFASLYTDQVAAFTTKAVANMGGNQLAAMTNEQISQGLDPAKIGALSASRVRYFNPSQISALTNPEVAAISLSTMKTLYDPHLRAFTVDQLSHLSEDKIDWLINKKLQLIGFTDAQKSAILTRKAFGIHDGPAQTSTVLLKVNFPSNASVISAAFSRTNPTTYNKSMALTVYDAEGNGSLGTVYYVKTKNADSTSPTNTWQTHVYVGDDAVNAQLEQATDGNGQKLYVNQYGQLSPYNQVKDELTTAKTQLFSLNELTDKRNSVPAAIGGKSVSTASFDFDNGVNFAAKNADANTATMDAAKAAGIAANLAAVPDLATTLGLTDATAVANLISVIATNTAQNKGYPTVNQSDKYTAELNAYMSNTANLAVADRANGDKVAAARADFDTAFSTQYGSDGYTATEKRIGDAVEIATSPETLGFGATKAQIAAAARKAIASVIAYDNAVTQGVQAGTATANTARGLNPGDQLTDSQKETITAVAIAAADGMRTSVNQDGYYNSVQASLSHLFDIDVDGSGNPVTLDLGYLAMSDTTINGADFAMAAANTLNKDFGSQNYFDLSSTANQKFQIITSGDITTDPATGAVTEYPIDIKLIPGTTPGLGVIKNPDGTLQLDDFGKPVYNERKVTINQMVSAIQTQLVTAGKPGIQVSYDYSASQFKFTDGTNTLKLKTADSGPNMNLKNPLFGLSQTAVTLVGGHYPAPNGGPIKPVIANGVSIRPVADQRYGMQVIYDFFNKTFTIQSGKTGDESSLKIEGVQPNSMAQNMMGLEANGLASDIPKNVVLTSITALRGIPSSPAIAVGTKPLKNISNNFTVDASNNKFMVTVDSVKGTVVIPIRNDYSLDTFKVALQKGINAMGTTNVNGAPTTVNGVVVTYDDANKRFIFTSGTRGAASFMKISGSADWGLDKVEAGRGADSTWIKPTQHKDKVSGVDLFKFIDGQGNETTNGDGFLNLPSWSPVYLTKGELTFNTSGKLVSPIQGTQLEPVYLGGGKGVLTININYNGSTQNNSPFAVLSEAQNGAGLS